MWRKKKTVFCRALHNAAHRKSHNYLDAKIKHRLQIITIFFVPFTIDLLVPTCQNLLPSSRRLAVHLQCVSEWCGAVPHIQITSSRGRAAQKLCDWNSQTPETRSAQEAREKRPGCRITGMHEEWTVPVWINLCWSLDIRFLSKWK